MDGAELIISEGNLCGNFSLLQKQSSGKAIFAVIKAQAYGHGAWEIAQLLEEKYAEEVLPFFCLARVSEVRELRKKGLKRPCLLMSGCFSKEDLLDLPKDTSLCVSTEEDLKILEKASLEPHNIGLHIHINTGMNRLGFASELFEDSEFLKRFGAQLSRLSERNFVIEGLMSHLACAEKGYEGVTTQQLNKFLSVHALLKNLWKQEWGHFPKWFHVDNSEGTFHSRNEHEVLNAIRPGLHLWGVQENSEIVSRSSELKPVARVRAKVRQVFCLKKGEALGYGLSYTAKEDTEVAIVCLGYADGLRRDAGEKNLALFIKGERCPFLGRISMDLSAVELKNKTSVTQGEWAYWVSQQQGAESIASALGTISYEVLTSLSSRVCRRVESEASRV